MRIRLVFIIALIAILLASVILVSGQTSGRPIERFSVTSAGEQALGSSSRPSLSGDGRFATFMSGAANLVAGDTNDFGDIFVKDRLTGKVERVSVSTSGAQSNYTSSRSLISSDGRLVVFESAASNLAPCQTTQRQMLFLHDRQTGETTCLVAGINGTEPNGWVSNAAMTPDGRYIAFESFASNLVPGDTNGYEDVFVLDRETSQLTCVSATPEGVTSYRGANNPSISANGRYIAYDAPESRLLPGYNSYSQIYLYDRQTSTTTRVSVGVDGKAGNKPSSAPHISADGLRVVFYSRADNLGFGTLSYKQILMYDQPTGEFSLISKSSAGALGDLDSEYPRISPDGRFITFASNASNLVTDDTNSISDIYLHDLLTGVTSRLSMAADGTQGNAYSSAWAEFSGDASLIGFTSSASNLVPNDTNGAPDVFVVGLEGAQPGTVQVIQDGGAVGGAQVYRNGILAGITDSDGSLVIPDLALGDQLVARRVVYTKAAAKSNHSGWAYRVYITSLDIPTNGEPEPYTVREILTPRILTLKKTNTLVGFNILASVEWDADPTYLNDLLMGFRNASQYFYDASDGQMVFEQVTIVDNNQWMSDADFQFRASNQEWPRAYLLGIGKGSVSHIYFGRYFNGISSNQGMWPNRSAFRVFIHEFGHFALGVNDSYEYYDGFVKKDGVCTSLDVMLFQGDPTNASLMFYPANATEFSMRGVGSQWSLDCEKTAQFQRLGESDWETIHREFSDPQSPPRWEMTTPLDHGGVVKGPDNIPVPVWTQMIISQDANTGVCAITPRYHFAQESQSAANASVLLQKSSRIIYQGKTDVSGNITVLGAAAGDQIHAVWWQGGPHHRSFLVTCPTTPNMNSIQSEPVREIQLIPDPYSVIVSTTPGALPNQLAITVQPSISLSSAPVATLMQNGTTSSLPIPLTLNPSTGQYVGQASLVPEFSGSGSILVQSVDLQNRTSTMIKQFGIEEVSTAQDRTVMSGDGLVEVYLPAGSLSSDTRVMVDTVSLPGSLPEGQELLSGPYALSLENGAQIQGNANLTIRYLDMNGSFLIADLASSQLYRWESDSWQPVEGSKSISNRFVSVSITSGGTFAVFADHRSFLYLPFILHLK